MSMVRVVGLLLLAASASFAEDAWAKVRDLKSGTELRVLKTGATQPVSATLDEATEGSLVVVVKNEQVAIPREQVERVEARPAQAGSRVVRETKTTVEGPERQMPPALGPRGGPGTSTSTSSGLRIGGKGEFTVVYRKGMGGSK